MAHKKIIKSFKLPKAVNKTSLALSTLMLDAENPRFGGALKDKSQEEIIEKLAEEKNLYELIESFRKNGYYEAEPLLVIENNKKAGEYIVVEGNRRVAALKILFDPQLLEKYNFGDTTLSDDIAEDLKNKIPVQVYSSRNDLWSYLGFRHIKGAMPWDPYSKALYITKLFDSGTSIEEIVARIGDQNSLVVNMSNGIKVLQQAEAEGFIEPMNMQKFAFSHLYTILGYTNTQKFLGLKIKAGTVLKNDPVFKKKVPNLKVLIDFIYGDKAGKNKPVIKSQNPDIRRLDAVLASTSTLADLKANVNQPGALENAFSATSEAEEIVPELIAEALAKLKKASGNLYMYRRADDRTKTMVQEIEQVAKYIMDQFNRSNGQKKSTKGKPKT